MDPRFGEHLAAELAGIREQGLFKEEWPIEGHQGPEIRVAGRPEPVLNFCANNYLGLSSDPELIASAHWALDQWGYGLSSVRFICGTQSLHLELEKRVSAFLGMEDASRSRRTARAFRASSRRTLPGPGPRRSSGRAATPSCPTTGLATAASSR